MSGIPPPGDPATGTRIRALHAMKKGDTSMSFADEEIAYLRSQPLTRLATVGPDGQPDVVPLAFEFDAHGFWVGGVGDAVARTRKFRNVAAGNDRVALVFDDLISLDPFAARCLRVYGRAGEPVERVSALVGPRPVHAHHPNHLMELEPRRQTRRRHVVSAAANDPPNDRRRLIVRTAGPLVIPPSLLRVPRRPQGGTAPA
jgi:pyridoxamine 5'-phosphate oxidase family protein